VVIRLSPARTIKANLPSPREPPSFNSIDFLPQVGAARSADLI
jgi:hypothetical protein